MTNITPQDEATLAARRDALRREDLRKRGRRFTLLGIACAAGTVVIAATTPWTGWSIAAAAAWFIGRGLWLQRRYMEDAADNPANPTRSADTA
jgi:hypothetical protein